MLPPETLSRLVDLEAKLRRRSSDEWVLLDQLHQAIHSLQFAENKRELREGMLRLVRVRALSKLYGESPEQLRLFNEIAVEIEYVQTAIRLME